MRKLAPLFLAALIFCSGCDKKLNSGAIALLDMASANATGREADFELNKSRIFCKNENDVMWLEAFLLKHGETLRVTAAALDKYSATAKKSGKITNNAIMALVDHLDVLEAQAYQWSEFVKNHLKAAYAPDEDKLKIWAKAHGGELSVQAKIFRDILKEVGAKYDSREEGGDHE